MKVAITALFLASSAAAATFRANRAIPADSRAANKLLAKAIRDDRPTEDGRPTQDGRPTWEGRPTQDDWEGRPTWEDRPTWEGRPTQEGRPTWEGRPTQDGRPTWEGRPTQDDWEGRPTQEDRPTWEGRPTQDDWEGRPTWEDRPTLEGRPTQDDWESRPTWEDRPTQDARPTRELEGEQEFDWVAGYSIKYTGCSSLMQVAGEENAGGEEGSLLYTQNLVKFSLCPSDYCSSGADTSCPNGARYVVDMGTFVQVYNEFQMDAQERACENLRENQCAYCENANDDQVCENQCFMDYEMEYCIEDENAEEFEVERYLECQEAEENQNQNNNNNYNYYNDWRQLYLGMYCAENKVLLGAFLDMGCSTLSEAGTYENQNYGNSLPYSSESLVQSDCISCKEVEENDNNNNNGNGNDDQQDEDRVIEMCEQVYEMSGKCETNLPENMVYYKDEGACDFLDNILPQLEAASAKVTSRNAGTGGGSAKFFAVVFAITTLALIGYVAYMHSQQSRKVDLSSKDAVEEQRREFT